MKNVFYYLDYYGNLTFDEVHFNDIDGLIFALLSYVKLKDIVPSDRFKTISLKQACVLFLSKYSEKDFKKEDWLFPSSYKLMVILANSKRYTSCKLGHFVIKTDKNGQFGALTIRAGDITYLSFEGTDSEVIGWKEDFELMYKFPIQSQIHAADYFNTTLTLFDRKVYLGGHSKGGNLAMYAYMYGKESFKKRVVQVYNFDGPGFLKDVLSSSLYEEMESKLKMVVPKESVVGMLLGHRDYMVVNSSAKGVLQHDAFTWECFGGFFVPSILSKKSKKLEMNLEEYLQGMSKEERKNFVETFFAVFEKTSIQNIMQLKELKISTLLNIMKEFKNVPSSTKRNLVAVLRMLITGMN